MSNNRLFSTFTRASYLAPVDIVLALFLFVVNKRFYIFLKFFIIFSIFFMHNNSLI